MKSNSDADWEKEVEIAEAEINQLEEQRTNAPKFLSIDISELPTVGKQFFLICVAEFFLLPLLWLFWPYLLFALPAVIVIVYFSIKLFID